MKFVRIGDRYYNTALIGWVLSKKDEVGADHYYVQFIGGSQQEITEAEYDEIIS